MDKTDLRILQELDKNPKLPLIKLAKKLRISQQVTDYRLKRIFKKKQITKLATIINLKSLGLEHYRVFFTFNSKKQYSDTKVFDYLRNKKEIYWAARIGGKFELLTVIFVKNFEEFDKFIDNFNHNFPGLIRGYKSCYVTEHYIYRHKYLSEDYSAITYGYNDKITTIDKLDNYILNKIKDNCRTSSLELSRNVNVSYKTIINRIKSLEKKRIILGYRMFLRCPEQKPFIILFSFRDYSKKEEKRLISYLGMENKITQTLRLFGVWNIFIHIRMEDNELLQNFIIKLRSKFSIIDNYEIIPVFEEISINLFPLKEK